MDLPSSWFHPAANVMAHKDVEDLIVKRNQNDYQSINQKSGTKEIP